MLISTAHDVRLTMGGEPTFVSIDDFESAEWNTAAVGPTKRVLADKLIRRLQARFAPGGMLHYGQGKWYPGESLPRWGFSLYWRKDGKPIWKNPALVAEIVSGDQAGPETSERARLSLGDELREEAHTLATNIAERLGLDAEYILPAYEDPAAWLVKEANLPEIPSPLDPKIEDPEERSRMIRTFARGLTKAAGYVLPVQRWNAQAGPAHTGEGRDGKAKNGPCGAAIFSLFPAIRQSATACPCRRCLGSRKRPIRLSIEQDPLEERGPLPDRHEIMQHFEHAAAAPGARQERIEQEAIAGAVRTALSVEPRDGVLCVFMPPVETLEDYLESGSGESKVAAAGIGAAGAYRRLSAALRSAHQRHQGDAGSRRHRGQYASCREAGAALVETTKGLYEDARQVRLGADKFMTDGRHTGTGGGNHVVLGGAVAR